MNFPAHLPHWMGKILNVWFIKPLWVKILWNCKNLKEKRFYFGGKPSCTRCDIMPNQIHSSFFHMKEKKCLFCQDVLLPIKHKEHNLLVPSHKKCSRDVHKWGRKRIICIFVKDRRQVRVVNPHCQLSTLFTMFLTPWMHNYPEPPGTNLLWLNSSTWLKTVHGPLPTVNRYSCTDQHCPPKNQI